MMLKRELDFKNKENNWLKSQISKICSNCSKYFNNDRNSLQTFPRSNLLKYGFVTSFLVVVCLVGAFFWTESYPNQLHISRILSSQVNLLLPDAQNSSLNLFRDEIKNLPRVIYENPPIIKSLENNKNNSGYFIDLSSLAKKDDNSSFMFLSKKRKEYIDSSKQRIKNSNKGFLRKNKDVCFNNNKFFWSIQDEEADLQQELNGLVIKNNLSNDDYLNNTVVSIGDVILEDKLKENIKSIFCRSYINDENNQNEGIIFNNILKKKILENSPENQDCIYLHLLFPGGKLDSENFYPNQNRKVFYEVGCKIFEVNKIYK